LTLLREPPEPLSGEEINRRLQVSQVAIWKQIGQPKESGTEIETGPKGYRLLSLSEVTFSWLFKERSSRIHYYPKLDSTMNRATILTHEGCPTYTVVFADRQDERTGTAAAAMTIGGGWLVFFGHP
jgi:BirA family transcriptional regulator, biotin operon repressor / biotin---[acetyl-CoA-carboxylase] ligase